MGRGWGCGEIGRDRKGERMIDDDCTAQNLMAGYNSFIICHELCDFSIFYNKDLIQAKMLQGMLMLSTHGRTTVLFGCLGKLKT